jgi:transmembrane sensor
MQRTSRGTPYNEQIRDEATEWFVCFCEQEVDSSTCKQFDTWLRASPEHVRAYLEISAFWEAADAMKPNIEIDELVRRARATSNVIPLEQAVGRVNLHAKKGLFRRRRLAVAASLLLAGLTVAFAAWWQLARYPTYATRIGEQRTVTLTDGSTVVLNADTRIKVRFTAATRVVDLVEGQALFHVAKNPSRPFIVFSGEARVRAVGTQFDVYQKTEGTVVTVVEGRVAVFSPPARSDTASASSGQVGTVLLSAGEQVTVTPRKLAAPRRANAAAVTAWTEGKLVFDSTPLSEVMQEFNRYSHRPLSIDDPEILNLHISGTFSTRDSTQITHFLAQRFGLVVNDTDEGIRLAHE